MNGKIKTDALEVARLACDTMMKKFDAPQLPPEGWFHYHQGVFLSGMMNIYKICGDEKYYEYVKAWVDARVADDGTISILDRTRLDDIQPGILLFDIYDRTKKEKYKKALETLIGILRTWHKNEAGGFWHKEMHPNEIWLDGIYMAGPIQAEYGMRSGESSLTDEAAKQAVIMWENMRDEKTGLLYHAWDCTKKIDWADKKTGLSSAFWGRSVGWYTVALLDILSFTDKESGYYKVLSDIERELLESVIKYQSGSSGMWYQVIDKTERSDNWCEVSCSCLFTASIARAVKMGILPEKYLLYAEKGFKGVYNSLKTENGNLLIGGVCVGTGVCDYAGYVSRPTSVNDLHGVGAFLLMCAAILNI